MPHVLPCPECQAGKCGNCDGTAWDFDYDEYTVCPCFSSNHGVSRSGATP
jgi:hypothetical protein